MTAVTWFLCCDNDEAVISTSTDITDLIRAQQYSNRETRITDTAPNYYDDRPDTSPDRDRIGGF